MPAFIYFKNNFSVHASGDISHQLNFEGYFVYR